MNTANASESPHKQVIPNASGHPSPEYPSVNVQSNHSVNAPHPAPIQIPGPAISPAQGITVYEGYTFFQADPIPGHSATWTRVERTEMHLPQSEFYRMVQKRATKFSAAQQYQNLADIRRAHVNQLIHEQRRIGPQLEWSCVYAKEFDRPSKPRNAHPDDYETVSMDIILLKRPMKTKAYPRTPMGDLVDLAQAHRQDKMEDQRAAYRAAEATVQQRPADMAPPRYKPVASPNIPAQAPTAGRMIQGPLPRPVSVTDPFTQLNLGQGNTADELERTMQEQYTGESIHLDKHPENWGSESSSSEDDDDDDESMIFDQASPGVDSSNDGDGMDCDCDDPPTPRAQRPQSRSPRRREPSLGPNYRKRSQGPIAERKERYRPRRYCDSDVMPAAKTHPSAKRTRSIVAGTLDTHSREKRGRIQRINDQELRTRLLDCEARIERWERALEHQAQLLQKLDAFQQLKPRRSCYDLSSMRH